MKELLKQPSFKLVSIRRWEEFIGEISGYNYISAKGSVPGSVWGHNNKDLRDADGRMAEVELRDVKAKTTPMPSIAVKPGSGFPSKRAVTGWLRVAAG